MPYVDVSYPLKERRLWARKRALLIDGEVLSRTATRLLLERHGYKVDEVLDGMEAIGLLDLNPHALDLVVMDFEMPLLTGMETLYALRTLLPELKALLCVASGGAVPAETLPERAAFLKKPCTPQAIWEGLAKVNGTSRQYLEEGRLASAHS